MNDPVRRRLVEALETPEQREQRARREEAREARRWRRVLADIGYTPAEFEEACAEFGRKFYGERK
jgi:hypothetical protein